MQSWMTTVKILTRFFSEEAMTVDMAAKHLAEGHVLADQMVIKVKGLRDAQGRAILKQVDRDRNTWTDEDWF